MKMDEEQKIILIVDDIELNRAILCELFHDHYRIIEAENGKMALEAVEKYGAEISVMLLDIVMPVMDGIEVLQEMQKGDWIDKIPVILITAESNEDTALQGYTMGVCDIINKPFNPDIVCRRVENVVELYDHKHHLETMVREQLKILDQQAEKLKRTNAFVIDALSTVVEFRNGESGAHIKRIRTITRELLEALSERYEEYRFSKDTIDTIASASAMHDIGKIAIPDFVLLKPGKLTKDEFEIMKTHTIRGCEILQSLNYAQDEEYYSYCYEICRHHHERWDGNGYPDGLKGEEISIWAQVVSLADVYEALVSERVYKPAYSHEKAMEMIMNGECGVFNPQLLKCFMEVSDVLRREVQEEDHPGEAGWKDSLKMPLQNCSLPPAIHKKEESLSDRTLWLLELEREKYRVLAELSGEIVFDFDAKSGVITFSEKYVETFGGSFVIPNALQKIQKSDRLGALDKELISGQLARLSPEHPNCKMEIRIRTADGIMTWFEVSAHALWQMEEEPELAGLIGKLTNIHDAKMETMRLKKQACTDPLTGLYNRNATEDLVSGYLRPGAAQRGILAFIDVDNFKAINDSYGHQYGDETLRYVGESLQGLFRKTDVIGRVGGDEFVVFLADAGQDGDLHQKAKMLCDVFRGNACDFELRGKISGSVGISQYPKDGNTFEELLNKADKALYCAKHSGKDQYAIYEPEMEFSQFQSILSDMDEQ